ncbi:MAG: autotransporter outer membrane beta-barrel domain-containing protein [Alphaproteobacteria bacterium]|nr:autotransporter outer membrane beta-barrel domain-containing protein [Alphaproteobacteria bacterium]
MILKWELDTDTDISAKQGKTSAETHTGFMYGRYNFDAFYLSGMFGVSRGKYNEAKSVEGISVNSKYRVMSMGAYLVAGMPMGMFTPEIGARFNSSVQYEYVDTANQIVHQKTTKKGTALAGIKVEKEVRLNKNLSVKPKADIYATYDFKRDHGTSIVTLRNGAEYQTQSVQMDRFGVEMGAGVSLIHKGNTEVSLDYIGKFKNDYTNHTGMINAIYHF